MLGELYCISPTKPDTGPLRTKPSLAQTRITTVIDIHRPSTLLREGSYQKSLSRNISRQAGAELGQAQLKLGLGYTSFFRQHAASIYGFVRQLVS